MSSRPDSISSSRNVVWCDTSYAPPRSGYSLRSVFSECGSEVTMRLNSAACERADVLLGERFPEAFLAHAPDVVARVALAVVEDPEVDAGRLVEPCDRPRDLLRARVEGRVVADEPEHVDRRLAGVGDLEVQLGRPLAAPALVLAERVAGLLDDLQRRLQLGGQLAVLDRAPAQLVDDRRLLDAHRAGLDARVALHARPDRLARDRRRRVEAVPVQHVAQVEHDVARRQRLAGGQRGARLDGSCPQRVQASSCSRCTGRKSASVA